MREALGLVRQQRFSQVVDRLAPVLRAHPSYIPLRLLLCQALLGLGRADEADVHLRYCLELDPDCGPACRYLGEIELGRNRLRAALRLLDEACRLSPNDGEARALLDRAQNQLGAASAPRATPPARPHHARPPGAPAQASPAEIGPRRLARGTGAPSPQRRRLTTLRDGFGDFLAEVGLLSRAQVRAALIYRRSRGVALTDAVISLGFASEPAIRRAQQAYFDAADRPPRSRPSSSR